MSLRRKILDTLSLGRRGGGCHGEERHTKGNNLPRVRIVGSPNVGKSAVFNSLTGAYVTVSNYPGTTVNMSRGKAVIAGEEFEVVDTPGMYSLLPITEEERIARSTLMEKKPEVILHVVDARNLDRMLPLTLQLIEGEFPIILDLNMMDEAETAGIEINIEKLEEELGIPVVATVATAGRGIKALRRRLGEYVSRQSRAD